MTSDSVNAKIIIQLKQSSKIISVIPHPHNFFILRMPHHNICKIDQLIVIINKS